MRSSAFLSLGPSSDSDLTSQAVETDSLADLDDGMASGRTSPNHPQGGATKPSSSSPRLPSLHGRCSPSPAPVSSAPKPEARPGRSLLFLRSPKKVGAGASKDVKSDYLDRASELISLAVQKEKEQDFQAAFSCYRNGVDLLLQGVQGWFGELDRSPFYFSFFPFKAVQQLGLVLCLYLDFPQVKPVPSGERQWRRRRLSTWCVQSR